MFRISLGYRKACPSIPSVIVKFFQTKAVSSNSPGGWGLLFLQFKYPLIAGLFKSQDQAGVGRTSMSLSPSPPPTYLSASVRSTMRWEGRRKGLRMRSFGFLHGNRMALWQVGKLGCLEVDSVFLWGWHRLWIHSQCFSGGTGELVC